MIEPTLSIIIVNWNTREITRDCLRSVREKVRGLDYEVIIVDNASSDGSAEMIRSEFPEFQLISNDENVGFGRANNQAMRVARGRYFLLLNSDTLVLDDSIEHLLDFAASEPDIGIAGCRLLFEDRTLQYSCYRFPSLRVAAFESLVFYKLVSRKSQGEILLSGYWPHDYARDVDWISGAVMLVRREVFEQTGGFDERIFMYGEEMEWCMRVRDLGWRIAFTPDGSIIHLEHKSADKKYGDKRIILCQQRLYDIYARRSGRLAMYALLLVGAAGSLIRVCYFGLRAMAKSKGHDYFSAQTRYYSRLLRHNLRMLSGRRFAAE